MTCGDHGGRTAAPAEVLQCEATAGAVSQGERRGHKPFDAELRVILLLLDALSVHALHSLGRGRLQIGAASATWPASWPAR
jgi:hypothetical protein